LQFSRTLAGFRRGVCRADLETPNPTKQLGPRRLRAVERYEHFLEQGPAAAAAGGTPPEDQENMGCEGEKDFRIDAFAENVTKAWIAMFFSTRRMDRASFLGADPHSGTENEKRRGQDPRRSQFACCSKG
jgi:hypothetical protein